MKNDNPLFSKIKSFRSNINHKLNSILSIKGAADYYRWLKYEPNSMKERIESLIKNFEYHLTSEEFEELKNYFKEKNILRQLTAYFNGDILNFNYMEIKEYIETHPLHSIIGCRLTTKEIEEAYEKSENNDAFEPLLNDGEESILNYEPESMIDFYAMELYLAQNGEISTSLSADTLDVHGNTEASGKVKTYTK